VLVQRREERRRGAHGAPEVAGRRARRAAGGRPGVVLRRVDIREAGARPVNPLPASAAVRKTFSQVFFLPSHGSCPQWHGCGFSPLLDMSLQ
jgi:hypothetical protein